MARVAIVASANYTDLVPMLLHFEQAATLRRVFRERGIETAPCSVADNTIQWTRLDSVIVKCAWDYVIDAPAFPRWLEMLDSMGVPLINNSSLVRWNHDKSYLADLQAAGISVAPFTLFPARTDMVTVLRWLRSGAPEQFVMKPSVSSGQSIVMLSSSASRSRIDPNCAQGGVFFTRDSLSIGRLPGEAACLSLAWGCVRPGITRLVRHDASIFEPAIDFGK